MPWAILTDMSGVAEISDGHHPTELAAIEAQILYLESEKTEIVDKIAAAKRRRRAINRSTK